MLGTVKGTIGFILGAIICLAQPATAATLTAMQSVLGGLYDEYAPATIAGNGENVLWIGGWLTESDKPYDRIHVATRNADGTYSWPQQALFRSGWQLNDPSVIQHPVFNWQ